MSIVALMEQILAIQIAIDCGAPGIIICAESYLIAGRDLDSDMILLLMEC